jgi:hypothetical protein
VSILPGIYASQITGHLVTGSYDSIATQTIGSGGSGAFSFTSIPSTYKHLQIRFIGRDNRASQNFDTLRLRFNSDTGTNYYIHYINGEGSTATASGFANNGIEVFRTTASTAGSNIFGGGVIDILDYGSTNKNKVTRALAGADINGAGEIWFSSGLWVNTAAITSIEIAPTNASLFSQYSSFALYGVKG